MKSELEKLKDYLAKKSICICDFGDCRTCNPKPRKLKKS